MLASNKRFNVSATDATWSESTETISFTRLIYSTAAHFTMSCSSDQLAARLQKIAKMSDEDFKYIHDLNNESTGE